MSGQDRAETSQERRPIRVLFMIDQICEMGGAERVFLNTIRLLPKDRFRCSIITFKIDPSLGIFDSLPCPHQVLPLRNVHDWNSVRVAQKIRGIVRNEKVDIVHTFFETSDLWGGLVSKMSGARTLVSSRRDMGILRSRKHDLGYRIMNPWFDMVLTVSEQVRQFCIQKDHLPPKKVLTLYNGLELDKIPHTNGTGALRNSLGIEASAPVVVAVGHIRRIKGIDVLVRAAGKVAREFPNVVFLVVGRNSEPAHFRELEVLIEKLGVQKNVRFLGETENIYPLLKMSDVFFLPSRSEGFSNALIEAMARGLPCVATRVGGNGEAVEEGHSGYLVENEDADSAADRIIALLRNPERAKEMGQAGRKIVEQKFTAEVMMERLVSLYDGLLAKGSN
jgi:glycosyltransferase involved in cell wall biosynthesis